MKSKRASGYTLIELMIVVAILTVLATLAMPRFQFLFQRANEAKTRSQLGTLRSALALYYSNTEGRIAYNGEPDGVPPDGENLTSILTPTYLSSIPVPYLEDPFDFPPGLSYDQQSQINMAHVPPRDVVFSSGTPTAILVNRPYVYDPSGGDIYLCDGNYSTTGDFYYTW